MELEKQETRLVGILHLGLADSAKRQKLAEIVFSTLNVVQMVVEVHSWRFVQKEMYKQAVMNVVGVVDMQQEMEPLR